LEHDPEAGVVLPAVYSSTTVDGDDNDVHPFPGGVTLVTAGAQTLTVTEKLSDITGSVTTMIGPGP
jgi:hypothetical protein